MNIFQKVKFSITSDFKWLRGNQCSLSERIRYVIEKYIALLAHKNKILYLNNTFEYDNKNTPVTLQAYPPEIQLLNTWIDLSKPKKILDIGANIGQFSITLGALHKNAQVYTFEANPFIYSTLVKNTKNHQNIHNHNFAIGPAGRMDFYYVPGSSAKGSFIKANSHINLNTNTPDKIEIELVELNESTCNNLNIPFEFDLIKIDVEGFEYDVLNSIREIKTEFLFMEFSMARTHQYSFHELLNRLHECFGKVEILYCDYIDLTKTHRTIGNLLVKFSN